MNVFSIFPFIAFLLGIYNIRVAWKNRMVPGARPFLGLMFGIQIYAVGNFFELNSASLESAIFWDNIQFLGTDSFTLFLPSFILILIGKWNKNSKIITYFLLCYVALGEYIIWFYPGLVRSEAELIYESVGIFLKYKWEVWLNIFAIFLMLELIFCSILLAYYGLKRKGLKKRQVFLISLGLWFPILIGSFTSLGLIPFINPKLDLSPLAYSVTNLIWTIGFFKLKIFHLIPLARDAVFQKLHDAILVTNDEWKILDANDSACQLFQLPFQILRNSPLLELTPDLYEKLANNKSEGWSEFEWVSKSFSLERSYIISIQEVFEQKGKFNTIVLKDITNSKLADERTKIIREQKEELERILINLKQAQDQLILSEKMVSLGNLISGIAHEINNPIAAIKAANQINQESFESIRDNFQLTLTIAKLLEPDEINAISAWLSERPVTPGQTFSADFRIERQKLSEKLKSFGALNSLPLADDLMSVGINNIPDDCAFLFADQKFKLVIDFLIKVLSINSGFLIIDYAASRTAKIVFSLRNFVHSDPNARKIKLKVSDSLETVITLYQNQWKKGVEIIREYSYDPEFFLYQEDILQLWTNLIQNAFYSMDYKGILKLTLSESKIDGFQAICVNVEDNGKGIPIEIQQKIFQPFYTTKPPGEGTGLGLEISRKVVAKHNGQISFESVPGRTVFQIYLPVT